MLQATARWEAFFSQIFLIESPCHYWGEICCYALYYYHLLKAFWRSNCSRFRLDSLSTWRFLKFPFFLTSRPSWSWRQLRQWCAYKAFHVLPALLCAAPDVCCRSSADWSPLSNSHTAALGCAIMNELTVKNQWWLLWMSKTFSLTETNLNLNQEYFKINKFNHDFTCEFISRNSAMISQYSLWHWVYTRIHDYEFIYDFIIMNSPFWIQRWIHTHEFWHMISWYSSWSWIHILIHIMNSYRISWSWIHMLHFMTYEFIHEFMYMKNIVKSDLKSFVPRFQILFCNTTRLSSSFLLITIQRQEVLRYVLLIWKCFIHWSYCHKNIQRAFLTQPFLALAWQRHGL